ncbi:transporter [Vibrio sp. UCD-FRSSP16_10]|uniref:VWA domain-containing protein n=1 Tax=unclassified Vibrio TaxID=2614977 RepID=UPI0007FBB6E3|nr:MULTISPECIES: VWA domain-containing protein [unclassified Vibrio]OBT07947.1 transporter [Vibrio sp. UCD-FRSSP16_30]OBT17122.1 transporter [Vibrio sp. UCD-FRSSP16_10]
MNSLFDWDIPATLSQFHFIRPWWIAGLLPLIAIHYLMTQQQDLIKQWQPVMSKNIIEHLTLEQHSRMRLTPLRLFMVFSVLATLIMAGPSWTKQTSPFFEDNAELIVALDVSGSMSDTDIQPSRLERAKQKIAQLAELRGDAKTGLVVFGGSSHVAMPVTKDNELFRYFLDVLDPSLLPDNQSKPESVIAPITHLLKQSKVSSTVLIVTDKTDQKAIDKLQQQFASLKHQVLVWGIGENPQSGRGSANKNSAKQNNDKGLADQQMQKLQSLAKAGHGSLTLFTHDSSDVEQVYKHIQSNLFAVNDNAQPWVDSGYFLLFLLLPIQLMWFRRGWTLQW